MSQEWPEQFYYEDEWPDEIAPVPTFDMPSQPTQIAADGMLRRFEERCAPFVNIELTVPLEMGFEQGQEIILFGNYFKILKVLKETVSTGSATKFVELLVTDSKEDFGDVFNDE